MKTAISVPDELFKKGESAAGRLKISRSQLYAQALAEYIEKLSDDQVTATLNELYATESSKPDPVLQAMALSSIDLERW